MYCITWVTWAWPARQDCISSTRRGSKLSSAAEAKIYCARDGLLRRAIDRGSYCITWIKQQLPPTHKNKSPTSVTVSKLLRRKNKTTESESTIYWHWRVVCWGNELAPQDNDQAHSVSPEKFHSKHSLKREESQTVLRNNILQYISSKLQYPINK